MSFYRFARAIVRLLGKIMYKYEVSGVENVPLNKGCILASNHVSNFDPITLGVFIKPQVYFMAKRELFKNPVLGYILKHLGAFPVDRGTGDTSAIAQAENIVQSGKVLGIFPEGHRSRDGRLQRGKSGVVLIAASVSCDVIPVGIEYGERLFLRRRARIIYGKPIKSEDFSISEKPERSELKAASGLLMGKIGELLGADKK